MYAGQLRESLRFEKRMEVADDGYGNRGGVWVEQFRAKANVAPLKGGEHVIAARLTGVSPVMITTRYSQDAALIDPSWRAVDNRSGTVYNIRDASNTDEKRRYIDMLAEQGTPT